MKKLLLSAVVLSVLGGAATNVMALEVGRNSPYDYRIKSVVYNPVNVVKIDAIAGVATHIVVAPDETYITHAFGDSESWTFAHKMNHFFVKPKQAMSDTNLVIVTDKRTYNIVLHFIGEETKKNADGTVSKSFIETPWAVRQAVLQLTYEYRHCCKVSDEAAFCLIQRPYISKTLLTRRISPRDHHNKMLRPGLCVVHASPQYL